MRFAFRLGILPVSLLTSSLVALVGPAQAGCSEEQVVDIAMAPGRSCWVYRGTATVFVGDFGAGQRITAHMRGEGSEYDEASGRSITRIGNRIPEVSGPANYSEGGADGVLSFFSPHAGVYRFSFSPCAMWGGNGIVEICAR